MNKKFYSNILFLFGIINLASVIISFFYLSSIPKQNISPLLYGILDIYVSYSFLPAALVIIITKILQQPKFALANYISNTIFLVAYTLIYLLYQTMMSGI